jgi:formylglycine-generating enzyme required for sulfatase activity
MPARVTVALLTAFVWAASAQAEAPIENRFGMRFLPIPAGSFVMGTDNPDTLVWEMPESKANAFDDEAPAHRVTLTAGFLLGETEVTQGQWYKIMGTKPGPDVHWNRDDWEKLPVVSVS